MTIQQEDILTSQPEPFLNLAMLDESLLYDGHLNDPKHSLLQVVQAIKSKTLDDDMRVTLDVIAEELQKDNPRIPVIKDMLANLTEDELMQDLHQKLTSFLNLKSQKPTR